MRFQKTITKHGIPLFVLEIPYLQCVAAGIWIKVGTRDEIGLHQRGIVHAIEHMVACASNKRLRNPIAVAREIESWGGNLNALTWQDGMFIRTVVPHLALEIAARSLASQVTEPLFLEEEIVREMKNVIHEIHEYHDDPSPYCADLFEKFIFGEHPLGRAVLGSEKAVSALTKADFESFHQRFFHPGNYALIVVGNTTLKKVERIFNKLYFGGGPSAVKNIRKKIEVRPRGFRRIVRREGLQQAHVRLGTIVVPSDENDVANLKFFHAMLYGVGDEGGMSHPLFSEIRTLGAFSYSADTNMTPFDECGVFDFSFSTDPAKVGEVIELVHNLIRTSAKSRSLFKITQRALMGRNMIEFIDPGKIIMRAVDETRFGEIPKSPTEIERRIKEFTFAGVQRSVEKHLYRKRQFGCVCIAPKGARVNFR